MNWIQKSHRFENKLHFIVVNLKLISELCKKNISSFKIVLRKIKKLFSLNFKKKKKEVMKSFKKKRRYRTLLTSKK
jgi:hypothetical protein